MKTTINNLQSLVNEYENRFELLGGTIKTCVYSTIIEDSNGKRNYIEDYKKDFENQYSEYNKILNDIETVKEIISRKKEDFKLHNGQTITGAMSSVKLLRKKAELLEELMKNKNSKRLISPDKDGGFEEKELNFNSKDIEYEYFCTKRNIQRYEAEIAKLSNTDFEINYYFTFD